MYIFEEVATDEMLAILPDLAPLAEQFYLGGGTALALQLGHRRSIDLDFFSLKEFDPDEIMFILHPQEIVGAHRNTLHCIHKNVRLTFLYYAVPLVFPLVSWHILRIEDLKDVVAEKFKTISQRGAKKDFCDLYAVFQERVTIQEGCQLFLKRFQDTGINVYAVLKSLTYFVDADNDPDPIWLTQKYSTDWGTVKDFFTQNARLLKQYLIGN